MALGAVCTFTKKETNIVLETVFGSNVYWMAARRALPLGASLDRLSAIVVGRNKWLNGTVLHYYFFGGADGSPAAWAVPEICAMLPACVANEALAIGVHVAPLCVPTPSPMKIVAGGPAAVRMTLI